MNKIKLIVFIVIFSVLVTGCMSTPKQNMTSITSMTPATNATLTPAPKLKIMSVTIGEATILQIPLTIKVKNIGDALAKDVYVGGIKVFFIPKNGNFTNRTDLINDGVRYVLTLPAGKVSYYIDTGIPNPDYNSNIVSYNQFSDVENLSVGIDQPENPDYLGDILPGEVKEGHISQVISSTAEYYVYVKVAWTDDKKEYAIY